MSEETNRRGFYLRFIYGLWGVIGAALAAPAAIYLLFPKGKAQAEWVEATEVAALPLRTPREVVFRRNRVDGWKVSSEKTSAWVVRQSETEVVAFAPQCTHLGCAYHWDQRGQQFLCPCHTTTFSLDGKVTSGPAPRPLDRYETRLEGGKLWLGPVRKSEEA